MLSPGKYLSAVLDLLFWGAWALAGFQYLLASSAGARGYMVLALAVGVCAEQIAIGHYVRRLGLAALRLLTRVLRAIIMALAVVLDVLASPIAMPLLRGARKSRAVGSFVGKVAMVWRQKAQRASKRDAP